MSSKYGNIHVEHTIAKIKTSKQSTISKLISTYVVSIGFGNISVLNMNNSPTWQSTKY